MSSFSSLFGGPTIDQLKTSLFTKMNKIGGTYLEATYSGGNDEGGVERIALFTVKDPEVRIDMSLPDSEVEWSDDDNTLYALCNDILATEFYTWAGEFEAYGTLYADAQTREVWREGSISHESYDSDSSVF